MSITLVRKASKLAWSISIRLTYWEYSCICECHIDTRDKYEDDFHKFIDQQRTGKTSEPDFKISACSFRLAGHNLDDMEFELISTGASSQGSQVSGTEHAATRSDFSSSWLELPSWRLSKFHELKEDLPPHALANLRSQHCQGQSLP